MKRPVRALLLTALLAAVSPAPAALAAPVPLDAAGTFAVLGGSTVTSAGVSTVNGDVGVSPGVAITGFPPGLLTGTLHEGGPVADAAHDDLATAYLDAAGRGPTSTIEGDLGGRTLTAGVHTAGAAISLAGKLTLDGNGDSGAVFVLQAGSTLGTAAGSSVELVGGAQACNVFWTVGSSATLGATSAFTGTVLAATSISMGDGATVDGRLLARDGAVTMINNEVSVPACAGALSTTAPTFAPFTAELTGSTQTVHTAVGGWSVTDDTGSDAGYTVTVSASAPSVDGDAAAGGTDGSVTLTPTAGHAAPGNPAVVGPVASSAQRLGGAAATIQSAAPGTGQGRWDFDADAGDEQSLAIVIPGDASAGAYSTTLTFTAAPLAAP